RKREFRCVLMQSISPVRPIDPGARPPAEHRKVGRRACAPRALAAARSRLRRREQCAPRALSPLPDRARESEFAAGL
ncbi:MAG TPA: hypothetical protein VGY54_08150, partial [Polyangiaceae bacterium]|nr:hypothetical protein [Polyangiaceae bacterium]